MRRFIAHWLIRAGLAFADRCERAALWLDPAIFSPPSLQLLIGEAAALVNSPRPE